MIFTFHVQIANIKKPPVWRRIVTPTSITFQKFHEIIQGAFGWSEMHLYNFSPNGWSSDEFIGEGEDDFYDARKVKLSSVFKLVGDKLTYIYDFGDDWEHKIVLEKKESGAIEFASCIAGKGMCPPEDCGGVMGYEQLKLTMADPNHPEYASMKEWLEVDDDEVFDPNYFDLEDAQEWVKCVELS